MGVAIQQNLLEKIAVKNHRIYRLFRDLVVMLAA